MDPGQFIISEEPAKSVQNSDNNLGKKAYIEVDIDVDFQELRYLTLVPFFSSLISASATSVPQGLIE